MNLKTREYSHARKGHKVTFEEIYNYVESGNFGVFPYREKVGISAGVKYALEHKALTNEQIENIIKRFTSGDFGTAYLWDGKPIKNHEYGQYNTNLTPSEKSTLWIARDYELIVLYFHFER